MEIATKSLTFVDRLRLIPFSCLHLGARAASEKKFERLVQWILSKPDTYAIGLGDYSDNIIRQDMKRFSGKVTKDELLTMLDSALNEERDLVIRKLKPLADAGRLLGLAEGNHEEAIKKHHSFDMMKDFCSTLKIPYLGYSFFYRLTITKKGRQKTRNVIIYGHHGFGGGRKSGSALNRREDIAGYYDADIILMAHDHQKFGKRFVRLAITERGTPRIVHKPVIVAATGSFLKTVVEGETTYSEKGGYRPNDIGVVRIDINIEGESGDLDMHVSE